jgi:hypothetical protein
MLNLNRLGIGGIIFLIGAVIYVINAWSVMSSRPSPKAIGEKQLVNYKGRILSQELYGTEQERTSSRVIFYNKNS